MYAVVVGFRPRSPGVLALCALLAAACGEAEERFVDVGEPGDDAMAGAGATGAEQPVRKCDRVRMEGDFLVEQEKDFTARFRVGEPYTRTVMLFGGEPLNDDNVLGNAYIFGLDKADAQMLAQRYPDFHLCSSPGGEEASNYIVPYDLLPATCEVYDGIVTALRQYHDNVEVGGDRTSLRLEGAPLQLDSVIADATGQDATDQVSGQDFHLVTSVEQLTGESVLSFGTE